MNTLDICSNTYLSNDWWESHSAGAAESTDEKQGSGLYDCHQNSQPSIMDFRRSSPDQSDFPVSRSMEEQAKFLLKYAILAPSSHNSEPWAFETSENEIQVFADTSRQLEIADPEGRELYLSVGCALENLTIAADQFGLNPSVEYIISEGIASAPENGLQPVATVKLNESAVAPTAESALFEAVPKRNTNHKPFKNRQIPDSLLDWVNKEAKAEVFGVKIVTDSSKRESIASLQKRADERLFNDSAYRAELAHWIGTGALGANWITARISKYVVRNLDLGEREGRKNSKLITSAPAVGVLSAESADSETWLRAGQAFERMALKATSKGVAIHPMSQILEVEEFRDELARLLDLEANRPVHLFRLGYANPDDTRTPRRSVGEVLR